MTRRWWSLAEMQRSLSLPGSGMCLSLLLSTMLFWEHVSSAPNTFVSTEDLYHRVVAQSHDTYMLAADIYAEYDGKFFKMSWFKDRTPSICHTASIHTPESREEVHETKTEDLLTAIINITQAWEEPLKHLIPALATLPGLSDNMLNSANSVKARNHGLLEGLKIILNRIQPGSEVINSPVWSGQKDLQSSDEDTFRFAVFSLCRCLRRDTHKTDTYLKVLRCREVFKNDCF